MKYFLSTLVVLLPMVASSAAFYTENHSVSDLSLGGTSIPGFRVKLEVMEDTEQSCNQNSWYVYPHTESDPNYSAAYSTLLASKISGTKVGFQIAGCVTSGDRTYPKITHIYVCDTGLCS